MQIMIDLTVANEPATLRRIAALLIDVAGSVPEGTVAKGPEPVAPVVIPPNPSLTDAGRIVPQAPVIPPPPAAIIPPPPPPAPENTVTAAAPSPAATTTAVAAVAGNVQLDKSGLPWDARIHSETPTINKSDGLWRMKRGIGDKRDVVEAVEAELRANYPAPVALPSLGVTVIPPPPVSLPAAPVIPPPPAVVAAPAAPAPTVMVPPPPPVAGSVPSGDGQGPDAFRALMKRVDGHTGPEGRLRREIMVPIYEELGLKSLTDFHKHRDKIPALMSKIDALLA